MIRTRDPLSPSEEQAFSGSTNSVSFEENTQDVAHRLSSFEPLGQSGGNQDPVETALADAIGRASIAGEWGIVGQLARELEARRTAREARNVVTLRPPKKDSR